MKLRNDIRNGKCAECGFFLEVRAIEFQEDENLLILCIEHFIAFAEMMEAT